MNNYRVTIRVCLDVDAENEQDAKYKAYDQISDYLRSNSLTDLMEVNRIVSKAAEQHICGRLEELVDKAMQRKRELERLLKGGEHGES